MASADMRDWGIQSYQYDVAFTNLFLQHSDRIINNHKPQSHLHLFPKSNHSRLENLVEWGHLDFPDFISILSFISELLCIHGESI